MWEACAGKANLAGLRGDGERAAHLTAQAERTGQLSGNISLLNGVQLARGLAALGSERPGQAHHELNRMMDRQDSAYHMPQSVWALDYVAEAATACGHVDEARGVLRDIEAVTGTTTSPGVRRTLALTRLLLAEDDDMEQRFTEATTLGAAASPWYRARVNLAYGAWLRRQRRVVASRGPLRAAQTVFDALAAPAWTARAIRLLLTASARQTGGRHHRWAA
ncbi:hypothetical protein [Streptomyces gilvus]|uniref:hypothetical protein n=1 Tax=Streptomyces gilvus TaxID=2920937 RepID=UPI001F0E4CBF|nr:hypothetical protein [Streptomyces sp. CME 23]MCH5676883.1 hypothetical protein [Streptomyces sp. CME 23]